MLCNVIDIIYNYFRISREMLYETSNLVSGKGEEFTVSTQILQMNKVQMKLFRWRCVSCFVCRPKHFTFWNPSYSSQLCSTPSSCIWSHSSFSMNYNSSDFQSKIIIKKNIIIIYNMTKNECNVAVNLQQKMNAMLQ